MSQRVDELHNVQNEFQHEAEPISVPDMTFGNGNHSADYYDYDDIYQFDTYEDDTHSMSHFQQDGSLKRPADDQEENIFSSYLKKLKKSETVDEEVNGQLTDIANNPFRDGMPDDVYSELIKSINRPANCESLKETGVNQGV